MFNLNSGGRTRQKFLQESGGAQVKGAAVPYGSIPQETQTVQENTPQLGGADAYAERRIEEIDAQRMAFAAKNPDFDMKTEMQNPAFVNYVWGNNLSVEDAYLLVHMEEIVDSARAEAIEEFRNAQNRIPENGASKNRPAMTSKNPKDLTDKEIDAIIERARNGEKITF